MKSITWVMIANILIKGVFTLSVTFAAVHFNNPWLMCWYLLLFGLGYDYKRETGEKKKDE